MRSFTTRLVVLIASVLIAFIIGIQVYWLNKQYAFEKNEFNTSVLKAIRGVYEDIPLLYNASLPIDSLVERKDANVFLFRVDSIPQRDSLLYQLSGELEDFHVFTDCKLALFDHAQQRYIYQGYVSADASKKNEDTVSSLPLLKREYSYVLLFFPDRGKYIIREMRTWIYASIILLLLLTAFSLAIYYLLKQKFLVEIQRDFINNVTHEFSTPLSVIDLSVEGLEKPGTISQTEKHGRYVASIKYQSAYLKSHITNLINTVVAEQYQLPFKKQAVVPNELLKKAALQLETLLAKKGGTVVWELEPRNIPILADEENLYLAFFNIINNAIKYAEVPKVVIATSCDDNRYIVRIRDNGPGIEPPQQKKIFHKFYRAQNGNLHTVKGLGLGLYFTRKVIDGHQGQIRVNSIPGIGTEFMIDLPVNAH